MAMWWELKAQRQVLVVVLTRETTVANWSASFRNLIIPGNPHSYVFLSGMPFDHARDRGCHLALEGGYEYIFFLDDDVLLHPESIIRLMSHKLPIVSGVYCRRAPPIVPVMMRNFAGGRHWVTQFFAPSLIEVDVVGAGCLLIHRSVLERLPPISHKYRWFEWRVDQTKCYLQTSSGEKSQGGIVNTHTMIELPPEERVSEDFAFCLHAKRHRYQIIVDTGCQCRHAGQSESRLGGPTGFEFVPMGS